MCRVDDSRLVAGMRDRLFRLRQIAAMTHNQEISDMVLAVAEDIQAEIDRLENVRGQQIKAPMPHQT